MTIKTISIVVLGVVALACGGEQATPSAQPGASSGATPASVAEAEAGEHAHTAPHGGTLVELGEHFGFLECVLDADAGTLTVFVLDGGAEQAVRIAQPTISVTFTAPDTLAGQTVALAGKANVLTGETVGDTSEFVAAHAALKGQTIFSARVTEVIVKGRTFKDLTVK